jgi:hypothetical protein
MSLTHLGREKRDTGTKTTGAVIRVEEIWGRTYCSLPILYSMAMDTKVLLHFFTSHIAFIMVNKRFSQACVRGVEGLRSFFDVCVASNGTEPRSECRCGLHLLVFSNPFLFAPANIAATDDVLSAHTYSPPPTKQMTSKKRHPNPGWPSPPSERKRGTLRGVNKTNTKCVPNARRGDPEMMPSSTHVHANIAPSGYD